MTGVTKFSFLKEFVTTKVRKAIDGLPFTPEGYNRAKSILTDRYGKSSEIVKAYVKDIMELPTVTGAQPRKIHEFYERLAFNVQSLETMGKLSEVNGYVTLTIDKLSGIRSDLVRNDEDWQNWDFVKLCEAVRSWTRRNPDESTQLEKQQDPSNRKRDKPSGQNRLYNTRQHDPKPRGCVYCDDSLAHKSRECQSVTSPDERKKILAQKKLCFNCTGANHRAAECNSKIACQLCTRRHHTSICSEQNVPGKKMLTATTGSEGIFPVVVINVDGVECRALIDTGAGSSYASAKLLNALNKQPFETRVRRVDMLMGSSLSKLEVYNTSIKSISGNFQMTVNLTKINKGELLSLDNPRYERLMEKYTHLKGVEMDDKDNKSKLPVHVVLGGGEYARIKTESRPHVGRDGEPIAELTKLGWFILSPGQEFDRNTMMLTQVSQSDYEDLCRLDVLGLEDSVEHDQRAVHEEFKEQLRRDPEGWYKTGLPWKGNLPSIPTNERGSICRLNKLTRKLQRDGINAEYDAIIREQQESGVIEAADGPAKGVEFYIPHKAVIRETAVSTKIRIVYDASARATPDAPSLNDCLYTGPPLQNKLWDVLIQQRGYPVLVAGDIQKAFLQIRIKENERDALRFHWRNGEHSELETMRFTRVLFGLAPSPFLLGGVIDCHLNMWEEKYPDTVTKLRRSLYVDDLLTGGLTVQQAQLRKDRAIEIFEDAAFKLHKWNSNAQELELNSDPSGDHEEQTYAKQQFGGKSSDTKLLGLKWDKGGDTLTIPFPNASSPMTKRGILSKLAKIYDPLGLVSPLTLEGKLIFRDVCNSKTPWDADINGPLRRRWVKWEQALPTGETVPRPIVQYREPVIDVELHAFGDASTQGVGAAVYSVVRQQGGTTQRLIAAKGRLAKQGLTVPRLELVSAHMATNLVTNVRNALQGVPEPTIYGWLDSTVALHWIEGNGQYKQFVTNRVSKIKQHPEITWRHVPTHDNPADLASRGGPESEIALWWNGPEWLQYPDQWPKNLVTQTSSASEAEGKVIREVLCAAHTESIPDAFDRVLDKHDLHRTLRITAWIARFAHNCRNRERRYGLLTTEEVITARTWWIQRVQRNYASETDRLQLNLKENDDDVLVCRGRIQGEYPVYLPDAHPFTEKVVQEAHWRTLHGGVGLTMARVREKYWVPRLRRLAKRVIKSCYGCRRFQAVAVAQPPPGNLPRDRTEGDHAFQVIGVDYAGPLTYRTRRGRAAKAYIALYTCSLTRALHLELTSTMETKEFLGTLKRFIARRGRPSKIYSDNGRTFVGAARWIRSVMADEKMQDFLISNEITWQFNLSRAPWWGGQFERMVGLVKTSLYKTIGKGCLTWDELQEVLLDVEVTLNNRPLSYVEEDLQLPTLTPNALMFTSSTTLPEMTPHRIENRDLRKRAKFLKRCKDVVWRRWTNEYVRGLRERHTRHNGKPLTIAVGEVVIIKSDERNRGEWPLGIITELYEGRDGIVRAARLRAGRSYLERPVQHLYPMELACDAREVQKPQALNAKALVYRPKRDAAAAAAQRIQQLAENTA